MMADADVEQWKGLCRKLNAMNNRLHKELDDAVTQHLKAEDKRKDAEAVADGLEWQVQELKADNDKLRELLSSYWKRTHSPVCPNVERDYLLELRKLGIEVE